MKLTIITDSSASLTKEEVQKYDVKVVPLTIDFAGVIYKDFYDIEIEDFYKKLVSSDTFPKTSQPSPNDFYRLYEEAKENNEEVLVLTISSLLSGTYQSAVIAKNMINYESIYVFDSKTTIQGLCILIHEAVRLRNQGVCAVEIMEELAKLRKRIVIFAQIDKLDYLHKGGRLSKSSAIIGNIIGLKPLITLNSDGNILLYDKAIGTSRGISSIMKSIQENPIDNDYPFYFGYTTDIEKLNRLKKKVLEKYEIKNSFTSIIGAAVGSHIGTGGFAVFYVKK